MASLLLTLSSLYFQWLVVILLYVDSKGWNRLFCSAAELTIDVPLQYRQTLHALTSVRAFTNSGAHFFAYSVYDQFFTT